MKCLLKCVCLCTGVKPCILMSPVLNSSSPGFEKTSPAFFKGNFEVRKARLKFLESGFCTGPSPSPVRVSQYAIFPNFIQCI